MKGQTLKRLLAVLVLAVSVGWISIPAYSYEISVYVQATCTKSEKYDDPKQNPENKKWEAIDKDGKKTEVAFGKDENPRDPKVYDQ